MLVVTLGDLLLDVVVRLDGPLALGADTRGETRTAPGGQAANVAAWAAHLGARARLVAARARDDGRALAEAGLRRHGVEVAGPELDGRCGVVVSIVAADGERSMLSDRGVSPELAPEDVDPAWLAGCDRLHLSGYSLMRAPIDAAAGRAVALARAAGASGQRRPLLVERHRGLRAGASARPPRPPWRRTSSSPTRPSARRSAPSRRRPAGC